MTVALMNAVLTTHFSKAHLEKLQLDASLPLPAPYKLFNNQKNWRNI